MAGVALDDEAYAPTLRALAERGTPIWVHASAHFYTRVPYDIGHPRHIDATLMRYPDASRHDRPRRLAVDGRRVHRRDPPSRRGDRVLDAATVLASASRAGRSTPLVAQRAALPGRIFFGSGAVSSPARMQRLVEQLAALDLGDDLAAWRGGGLLRWLGAGA